MLMTAHVSSAGRRLLGFGSELSFVAHFLTCFIFSILFALLDSSK